MPGYYSFKNRLIKFKMKQDFDGCHGKKMEVMFIVT